MSMDSLVRIDADLLIPGAGEPVSQATLLLAGSRIHWVGPTAAAPPGLAPMLRVPTVMPGMWDCHVHLLGLRHASLEDLPFQSPALTGARAAGDLSAALQAGFTTVREAGGYGVDIRPALEDGTVDGPRIYSAGAIISPTGGHGDVHTLPLPVMHEYARQGGLYYLADGEDECIRAVRTQIRRGADVIKVCASGGVTTQRDDPQHRQFSDRELRSIVEEAARSGRAVMAHCHGKEGILAALAAGCSSIEHGTYLDDECAEAMIERDAVLVPTRLIIERLLSRGRDTGMPSASFEKLQRVGDKHLQALEVARVAGVRLAMGTDIFMSGADAAVPWGAHAEELVYLAAAGFDALSCIRAATADAPASLGPRAPQLGRLEAGLIADVIAVDGNPLSDISLLADAARITHVWQGGLLAKGAYM